MERWKDGVGIFSHSNSDIVPAGIIRKTVAPRYWYLLAAGSAYNNPSHCAELRGMKNRIMYIYFCVGHD